MESNGGAIGGEEEKDEHVIPGMNTNTNTAFTAISFKVHLPPVPSGASTVPLSANLTWTNLNFANWLFAG